MRAPLYVDNSAGSTAKHVLYENFVLENKMEDMLITLLDVNQFLTPDYSLAENAGMKMQNIAEQPMLALSYLWYAAIYAKQPMQFNKACDLLDDYLDSEECTESIQDMLTVLSDEYVDVFGLAAE